MGKSARDLLTSFYQERDPSKLPNVEKVLQKYQGNEETMFRNLAKKYGIDPSKFGVAAAPPANAFGSPSAGMPSAFSASGSTFGQQSTLGSAAGGPSMLSSMSGGHAFGSAAGGPPMGGTSFGSLAGGGGTGGFGGQTPFGAPAPMSTPFGAPRR